MTRVRMLTMASGPDFQCHPGQEIDLPAAVAAALVEGGYARLLAEEPVVDRDEPRPETDEAEDTDEEWTSTPEETREAPMETATSGPQRQAGADNQVAAERAGREAAAADEPLTANPYDGRSAMGRAWARGWKAAHAE